MDALVVTISINCLISIACWILAGRTIGLHRWLVLAGDWLEESEVAVENWPLMDLAIAQKQYQVLQFQRSYQTGAGLVDRGRQLFSLLRWLRELQLLRK
jgi:hypothetical protein